MRLPNLSEKCVENTLLIFFIFQSVHGLLHRTSETIRTLSLVVAE